MSERDSQNDLQDKVFVLVTGANRYCTSLRILPLQG
jgi:hypothetical protein